MPLEQEEWRTDLRGRLTISGVVGLALGLVVWVAIRLLTAGVLCGGQDGWGCLGLSLFTLPLFAGLLTILGWVALRVAKVWLGGLIATVGLVVVGILVGFSSNLDLDGNAINMIIVVPTG